jgi:hypothetical protein
MFNDGDFGAALSRTPLLLYLNPDSMIPKLRLARVRSACRSCVNCNLSRRTSFRAVEACSALSVSSRVCVV